MSPVKQKKGNNGAANRLCANCRRPCKQPASAVISKCPRYYPINSRIRDTVEWTQMELLQ